MGDSAARGSGTRAFLILLGVLMVASTALQLHYRLQLGFLGDEWSFILYRSGGGFTDFLEPYNQHLVAIPVAAYKASFAIFGLGTDLPLQIFSIAVFLLAVLMLFIWARKLVGDPASVIGCGLILFLGYAWEDLLFSFQMGFSISLAAGLAALILLRRGDRIGDLWASTMLLVSVLAVSLGIPFMIGVAVQILAPRDRSWRRLWVPLVPIVLYACWYFRYGRDTAGPLTYSNVVHVPQYVFDAFQRAVSVTTGALEIPGTFGDWFSRLLAVAVVAGVGASLFIRRTVPRPLLVAASIALSFWILSALNVNPLRSFEASRYQLPGAFFIVMMLAGAFEGVRAERKALLVLALLAVVAVVPNIHALDRGFREGYLPSYEKGKVSATAMDISRNTVAPDFYVDLLLFLDSDASDFFAAEDRHGRLGWSQDELKSQSNGNRTAVDQIVMHALPVTARKTRWPASQCGIGEPLIQGETIPLQSPEFIVRSKTDTYVTLGRFGDGAPNGLSRNEGGSSTFVHIPPDRSSVPWRAGIAGGDGQFCALPKRRG